MSQIEQSWPADACDAVSIWAPGGDITIEGYDGDQITLEGDLPGLFHNNRIEQVERWLLINLWEAPADDVSLTLRLPGSKLWTVQLSSGEGDLVVRDIAARLQISLQRGDIRADNCRGVFALSCSEGDVELKNCREMEMPDAPAPLSQMRPPLAMGTPPPVPPFPPFPSGAWPSRTVEDLTRWAREASEQARQFAHGMSRSFHQMEWQPLQAGIGVQISHGEVQIEDIEAQTCAIRVSKGDTTIEGGWIGSLDLHSGSGDIECESVLPTGPWTIESAHGDISLALPANAEVRLDAATRHGDIHSDAPMVRVGRPGPEGRYGGRMVASLSGGHGDPAPVSVEARHGDIEIRVERTPSAFSDMRDAANAAAATRPPQPASDSGSQPGQAGEPEPAYASEMAILEALSEKQITAEEAEKLLLSLGA